MLSAAQERFPAAPPAQISEMLGRAIVATGLLGIGYALLEPAVAALVESKPAPHLWFSPRLALYLIAIGYALALGTARMRLLPLMLLGTLAIAGMCSLRADLIEVTPAPERTQEVVERFTLFSPTILTFLRLSAGICAAICTGAAISRSIRAPSELLTVLLCAAAGDVWLGVLRIPERADPAHPIALLTLPWPPNVGLEGGFVQTAPRFTDIFFTAVCIDSAQRFGLSQRAVVGGAVVGFAMAALLAPVWNMPLVLPLLGFGILAGAWSEFRIEIHQVVKSFVVAMILFAILLGFTQLRKALYPPAKPRLYPTQTRDMT